MRQIVHFLIKYVPGFKEAYLSQSGTTVGVRESRRVMGHYRLTVDDVLSARRFQDGMLAVLIRLISTTLPVRDFTETTASRSGL